MKKIVCVAVLSFTILWTNQAFCYSGEKDCLSLFKYKSYDPKQSCNCLYNAAKNNGIKDFEEFITVIKDESRLKALMANMLYMDGLSDKTKSYIAALRESTSFCTLNYSQPDTKLVSSIDNKIIKRIGDYGILLDNERFNALNIEKYLYNGSTIEGIRNFIEDNIVNPNIKTALEQSKESDSKLFNELENHFSECKDDVVKCELTNGFSQFHIINVFNTDFSRFYDYYINYKNSTNQEALDQAYYIAYLSMINVINESGLPNLYKQTFSYTDSTDYPFVLSPAMKKESVKYKDLIKS